MIESAVAFGLFAALLTITPGLDTVLILRTAATDGRRQAYLAALGISCGLLFWALAGGLGITAVLAASRLLYDILRIAGAIYLCWLGVSMLRRSKVETASKSMAGTWSKVCCGFALLITVVSRARAMLARPKVRRVLDRVTATVFVALGLRLAFDR